MTVSTAPKPEAPAPPEPVEPRSKPFPKALIIAFIALPTLLILLVMTGVFSGIGRGEGLLSFPDVLIANTPTGGDMGAHVNPAWCKIEGTIR